MNRIKAVQRALDGRVKPLYLEIGVSRGAAFRHISADEKIAVDPAFKLSRRSRRRADAQARATHYFETTSDAFFANEKAFLEQRGIDVALIDGLHTYGQVLRDVENTLRYLRDDGVIILHDCNPANASIACPATSYAHFLAQNRWRDVLARTIYIAPWSGDVWKAIVSLRSTRHDLRVAVLKCDLGVGVVRKGFPESRLSYSAAQIEALDYKDLAADRDRLVNLKPPAHLGEFLTSDAMNGSAPDRAPHHTQDCAPVGEYDLTAIIVARRSMEQAETELIRLSVAAVKYGHAIETVAQAAAVPPSTIREWHRNELLDERNELTGS